MVDLSQSDHLIQALAGYPKKLEKYIQDLSEEALLWQPAAQEWSIQMVLTHLSNCEPFFQTRLERIVQEDNPFLPYFGPEQAIAISEKAALAVFEEFSERRQASLQQIYRYSASDWERPAIHETMGATTFQNQIQVIVHHDLEHLGQIHDVIVLREKAGQGKGKR